jgi:hypothetical protein
MPTIKQLAKSKTVQFNATTVPAILALLKVCGFAINPWIALGVVLVSNIGLRLLTKKPLTEK